MDSTILINNNCDIIFVEFSDNKYVVSFGLSTGMSEYPIAYIGNINCAMLVYEHEIKQFYPDYKTYYKTQKTISCKFSKSVMNVYCDGEYELTICTDGWEFDIVGYEPSEIRENAIYADFQKAIYQKENNIVLKFNDCEYVLDCEGDNIMLPPHTNQEFPHH